MLQKSYDSLQAIGNQRKIDTQIISHLEPRVLRPSPRMNYFCVYSIIQQDPDSVNFYDKPFPNF